MVETIRGFSVAGVIMIVNVPAGEARTAPWPKPPVAYVFIISGSPPLGDPPVMRSLIPPAPSDS